MTRKALVQSSSAMRSAGLCCLVALLNDHRSGASSHLFPKQRRSELEDPVRYNHLSFLSETTERHSECRCAAQSVD